MNVSELFDWVQDHPILAAVLGITGLLIILWLLGVFSSSKASTNDGGNMASAYYAAEAAQAAAGAQIQTTQIQATAATSIAARQAMMNEALANTQANAAVIINGQNTGAAATINSQNTGAAIVIDAQQGYTQRVLSNDQLQSTVNTNYWAGMTAAANNETALAINRDNNRTSLFASLMNNIIPMEIANGAIERQGRVYQIGDITAQIGIGPTPNWARAVGYSEAQLEQLRTAGRIA